MKKLTSIKGGDSLTNVSALHTNFYIVVDVVVLIFLLILMFKYPHPIIVFLGAILVARQQYALGVLGHDAVHNRLYKTKSLNILIGRYLFNGASYLNFDGYKETHLKHHRYTMKENDPDVRFVSDFPVTKLKLAMQFLPDVLALTWLYLFLYYNKQAYKVSGTMSSLLLSNVPAITVNIVVFALFYRLEQPGLYFLYWVVPFVVVLPVFMHIRGICEHAGLIASDIQMNCTRTVINPIQVFFIAPHNLNYHMEHHTNPAIPHYNLAKYHKLLKVNNHLKIDNLFTSYWPIIRLITSNKKA